MRLEEAAVSGEAVEMEEEFRKLTLQIIGEAFLSLPPEECDRVSTTNSTLRSIWSMGAQSICSWTPTV